MSFVPGFILLLITIHMVYAYQVLDDSSAVDSRLERYVAINLDWQTSYAADIPLCASTVDKFVNLCTDDVVKIDDMLALVMLLHASLSRSFCKHMDHIIS